MASTASLCSTLSSEAHELAHAGWNLALCALWYEMLQSVPGGSVNAAWQSRVLFRPRELATNEWKESQAVQNILDEQVLATIAELSS